MEGQIKLLLKKTVPSACLGALRDVFLNSTFYF